MAFNLMWAFKDVRQTMAFSPNPKNVIRYGWAVCRKFLFLSKPVLTLGYQRLCHCPLEPNTF